jgi:hypothetical protein
MSEQANQCAHSTNCKHYDGPGAIVGTVPVFKDSDGFDSRQINIPIPLGLKAHRLCVAFLTPNGKIAFAVSFDGDDDGTCAQIDRCGKRGFSMIFERVDKA